MYFPAGYHADRAIELGELICQAYTQFEAFENERAWELTGGYSLRMELTYPWSARHALDRAGRNFDLTFRRLSRSLKTKTVQIPIGFIAQRRENYYLILRGTQTVTEWIRNFGISLGSYLLPKFGRVHGGFLDTWSRIRAASVEALSTMSPRAKLYVAGHSLGAAVTVCAAPDIETSTKRRVQALYTFGSPRVGDDRFVKAFNGVFGSRSFRIANTCDIVTSIPLPVPIAGIVGGYFSHVDTPIDMTVQRDDLEQNHSMRTYLAALAESRGRKRLFETILRAGAP
jgi:predicted lipase